jgi:hypothetical protein
MYSVSKIGKYITPDLAAYGTVFLLLFFIGIMGGRIIGKNKLFQDFQEKEMIVESDSSIGNGQRNLLAIGVDQIKSPDPILESIWLLISFPGKSSLTLIPIYPTVEGGVPLADSTLAQLFSISAEGIPDINFFDHLRDQIWWDNYFLIDKEGFTAVLELLNRSEPDFEVASNIASLPPAWQDPDGALQGQTQLMKMACVRTSKLLGQIKTSEFIQKIQPHILTDLNWGEISQQWSFGQPDSLQIDCEFPTLVLEIQ